MEFKNAVRVPNGVDCDINHHVFGWIPTTARPTDEATKDIYEIVSKWLDDNEPVDQ